eukprot:scaffold310993_cov32-Tisochrysis_lutea.AAC.5
MTRPCPVEFAGIVRYHEHFVSGETLCVVMAYCEGGDLSREIKRRAAAKRPFSEAQVREWTKMLCSDGLCAHDGTTARLVVHAIASGLAQVLDWFVQMVMALRYVHSKRILHRDLKTQNIFIAHHQVRSYLKMLCLPPANWTE